MAKRKEKLISIRMPSSLAKALRKKANEKFCLDLSEHIRSVIRSACLSYVDPYSSEMQKFRNELKQDLIEKAKTKSQLVNDLKRIIEELAND